MWLNKNQIEKCINWLQANASPPVRYLTHCRLLSMNPQEKAAKKMWSDVEKSKTAQEAFSNQRTDGSWYTGGKWAGKPRYMPQAGYSPFTPKYVTTVWILMVLGEMGFRIGDPRIDKACEYIFAHQLPNGIFLRFAKSSDDPKKQMMGSLANAPCELSQYLKALGSIGMTEDHRLDKSYSLLLEWQRNDGGWVSQKHLEERFKTRSCPSVTHNAAIALYQRKNVKCEAALKSALEFLIWHLSLKDPDKILIFRFRGHEILKEMLIYSDLGIGLDTQPIQAILDWLKSMYDAKLGCFHFSGGKAEATDRGLQAAKYLLFQCIEDDWLTYHILRIALNLQKH